MTKLCSAIVSFTLSIIEGSFDIHLCSYIPRKRQAWTLITIRVGVRVEERYSTNRFMIDGGKCDMIVNRLTDIPSGRRQRR